MLVATASGLAWSWRASSTAFARRPEMTRTFSRPAPQTGTGYRSALETPAATESGPHSAAVFLGGDDPVRCVAEAHRALRAAGAVRALGLVGVGEPASITLS
jgi:hypothetical protein